MATTLASILSGYHKIYVKALAASDTPASPVTANAVSWTGWTQIPSITDGGSKLDYDPGSFVEVKLDEYPTPVKVFMGDGEALKLSGECAETSLAILDNFLAASVYAAGAVPGTNPNTLNIGGGTVAQFMVGVQGIAATSTATVSKELVIWLRKCYSSGKPSIAMKRAGVRVCAFEFTAITDIAASDGQYLGIVYELTQAA